MFSSVKKSQDKSDVWWEWTLEHCNGFVEEKADRNLTIKQSGRYFVYGQLNREEKEERRFTLRLYKEPGILLNMVEGQNNGSGDTVYFGRPFFLQEGDTVCWQTNYDLTSLLAENLTYWGLYKI